MPRNLTTEEREARLPGWAKEEIKRLRLRAFRAEEELAAHRSGAYGPPDSDTVVSPYRDVPLSLPKGSTIEYRLQGGGRIRARATGDVLELMGDGQLTITPKVTNVVEVRSAR